MRSGEYTISCEKCQFEGRWIEPHTIGLYFPDEGCHISAIQKGWCNSCNTIQKLYTGTAGEYQLWQYGVLEEPSFFKRIFPSEEYKEYKAALKRMKIDQEKAAEYFNPEQKPRCFECSSHDVKVGTSEFIPHGCGAPLQLELQTEVRGSVSRIRWSYYDNTGIIVRRETKSMYSLGPRANNQ